MPQVRRRWWAARQMGQRRIDEVRCGAGERSSGGTAAAAHAVCDEVNVGRPVILLVHVAKRK